jgi:Putative beta-barrel porin-2, OmpL-like. bbp2
MLNALLLGTAVCLSAPSLSTQLSLATDPPSAAVPAAADPFDFEATFVPAAPPLTSVSTSSPSASPPGVSLPGDRWLLMQSLQGTWEGAQLDDNRMSISGWIDASFDGSTDHGTNLPFGFNYLPNQFELQQAWFRFDRSVVTSGTSEPTFGFRSDWVVGVDYRFILARGLFSGQLTADHGNPDTYGVDPVQFYGEAYFPTVAQGMDVKVGRFFALYGVETIDAPSNYFLSHSYTDIYDPYTHTGILTTTKLSDAWTVQVGLVLGSDDFIDTVDNPTFVGSVKWTGTDRDSVLFNVILDDGRFNQAQDFHNPELFDLIYTHKFSDRFTYLSEALFGFTTNVPAIGTAEWFGLPNYFNYQLTPRLAANLRLELFDDIQGQRTGFPGLYEDVTAGVSFQPIKAVTIRPELRYDYQDESAPFEGKHWLFTASTDVILRW